MPSAGRPPEVVTGTPRMGFVRMGSALTVWLAILTIPPVARAQPAPVNTAATIDEIAGNYRFPDGTIVGVSPFSGGGPLVPFFAHYTTGVIRTLYPDGVDRFVMGPAFARQSPVEQRIRIIRDPSGAVIGVGLQPAGGPESVAQRVPESVEPVRFSSSDATLDGWLIKPAGPGPHPAIVLLHGSGPLTRTSFGPYPRYFASLGFAVIIYDKRGVGRSTGTLFPRTAFYPEPYVRDAQAALALLAARSDIDSKQIGLWGTSEGGMLTTQVAARQPVAFAINSSGFMMPLWEQVLYNIDAQLRTDGFPEAEVAEAVAFETMAMRVMRTGEGWEAYERAQASAVQTKWWRAYFGATKGFPTLEALRWQWDHAYSFDPLPALRQVSAPVLGLFGALDTSTPAARTSSNMESALRQAGHRDVTVRIFERGNHPLMEARSGANSEVPDLERMAPGVFDTLRAWTAARIRFPSKSR